MKTSRLVLAVLLLGGMTAGSASAQEENYQYPANGNYGGGSGGFNSGYHPSYNSSGTFSHFPSASLNNMLNQVEQGSGWQGPSGMGAQGANSGQQGGLMSGGSGGSPSGYQSYPAMSPVGSMRPQGMGSMGMQQGMGTGMMPQGMGTGMMPQNTGMAMAPPSGGLLNGFAPFGGMKQPLQSGPSPFSPKGLLRIFFEGGSPGMGGGSSGGSSGNSPEQQAKNASVTGQAEALLNRARNQDAQAVSDAERAHKGYGDKGSRLAAASSAQYHANDARAAADEAANLTYSGPQYAKDYAAQARNAANHAQEAADRAAYNANVE